MPLQNQINNTVQKPRDHFPSNENSSREVMYPRENLNTKILLIIHYQKKFISKNRYSLLIVKIVRPVHQMQPISIKFTSAQVQFGQSIRVKGSTR